MRQLLLVACLLILEPCKLALSQDFIQSDSQYSPYLVCKDDWSCNEFHESPICSTVDGECCSCTRPSGFRLTSGKCSCIAGDSSCMLGEPLHVSNAKACFMSCMRSRNCHAVDVFMGFSVPGFSMNGSWDSQSFVCRQFNAPATGDGSSSGTCWVAAGADAKCSKHVACKHLAGHCCPTDDGTTLSCCLYTAPTDLGRILSWLLYTIVACTFVLCAVTYIRTTFKGKAQRSAGSGRGPNHSLDSRPVNSVNDFEKIKTELKWFWPGISDWMLRYFERKISEDDINQISEAITGGNCMLGLRHFDEGRQGTMNVMRDDKPDERRRFKDSDCWTEGDVDRSRWRPGRCDALCAKNHFFVAPTRELRKLTLVRWAIAGILPLVSFIDAECPNGNSAFATIPVAPFVIICIVLWRIAETQKRIAPLTWPSLIMESHGYKKSCIDFSKYSFEWLCALFGLLSVLQNYSLCMNCVFLGRTLRMGSCDRTEELDLFFKLWEKKSRTSFIGYLAKLVGLTPSFLSEVAVIWSVQIVLQPIFAILYVWDVDKNAERSPGKFASPMIRDQDYAGSMTMFAEINEMTLITTFMDAVFENEIEVRSRFQVENEIEVRSRFQVTLKILHNQVARGIYRVGMSGFLQKAALLHLQTFQVAVVYQSFGRFDTITLISMISNFVALSLTFRKIPPTRRLFNDYKRMAFQSEWFPSVADPWGRTQWMYRLFLLCCSLFSLSFLYAFVKVHGLATCESRMQNIDGCVAIE